MIYQDIYPHLQQPYLDTSTWSFAIGGRVRHPFIVSYSNLLEEAMVAVTCAVPCAGSPFDETSIEQAAWRGVPLRALLEQIEIGVDVRYAVIHNAVGYSTSLSIDRLMRGILVLEQDGLALSPEQGHPARLIVPGLFGYKMPRWVTRIELTDIPRGFWEARGWNGDGVVPAVAAISRPYSRARVQGTVILEGFAYGGEERLTAVEVSVDNADWMPVEFTPARPVSLERWQTVWRPRAPGDYYVRVRAVDESGRFHTKSAVRESIFPSKHESLHGIIIHVTE